MKSRLSLSLILLILISTFGIGSFFLTKPAKADVISDAINTIKAINSIRNLATDMDKWTSNFTVAVANDASQAIYLGNCTPSDLSSGGGAAFNAKLDTCINGTYASKLGPQSAQGVSPSMLGVVYNVAAGAPQHVDALPVNMALYLDSVKRDSPLIPQSAYAAGTFTDVIFGSSILSLWTAFRNIAYLLFVLVLVAFGFMVMFRHEIKPQTVITVQDALPKVVVALLLITFSYPIAAFALGLIPVLSGFAHSLIVFDPFKNGVPGTLAGIIKSDWAVVSIVSNNATNAGGAALFAIVLALVLIVAYLLALVAVVISYFTRFARIMLMTIFAPFQFLAGALPGKDELITSWFKSLIGNVLAIPAMWLMVSLGTSIITQGPVALQSSVAANVANTPFAFFGLIFNWVIGVWFVWTARKAPQFIENALQVGGGWSPGSPPKPKGGKK